MLSIDKITAKDLLFWKELELAIEPGVTRISGENGAGKTLMWAALDHALGMEQGKRGTSANRLPAGANVGMNFSVDKDEYELGVKPASIFLRKNAKDLGLRGKNAPREHLDSLINIPKSLYDCTVHLVGKATHPLSTGTAGSRLQWIGDVFGINSAYDELLRKIESRFRKVKDNHALLGEVKQQLAGIPEPREPMVTKDLKKELDEALERLKFVDNEIERREKIEDLTDKITLNYTVDELERLIGVTKKAIKKYRAAAVEQAAFEKAQEAHEKIGKALAKIRARQEELAEFRSDTSTKKLRKREQELLIEYEKLLPSAQAWEEQEDYRNFIAKAKKPKLPKKKVGAALGRAEAQLVERQEELSAIQSVDHSHAKGGQCPTCGTNLDKKKFKSIEVRIEGEITTLKAKIKELRPQVEYYEALDEITVDKNPVPAIEALAKKIKKLRKGLKAVEELNLLDAREKELRASLTDLPKKPKPVVDDVGQPVKNLEKKLDELDEQLEVLNRDVELREQVDELMKVKSKFPKFNDKQLALARKQFKALAEEHENLYLENIRVEAIYKEVTAEQTKLRERIKELKKGAKIAEKLQILRDYAGPKGGRIAAIKETVDKFVSQLNRLAPIMWGQAFIFDAECDDTGLTLYATRNGVRSDLTSLSGGEDKCWRSLCALVLLQILPSDMRVDTIILDEIESNLSPNARYRFCRDFIPELNKVVEKVVIVSPLGDDEMPLIADRSYRVLMQNGVSKLINEHEAQLLRFKPTTTRKKAA